MAGPETLPYNPPPSSSKFQRSAATRTRLKLNPPHTEIATSMIQMPKHITASVSVAISPSQDRHRHWDWILVVVKPLWYGGCQSVKTCGQEMT